MTEKLEMHFASTEAAEKWYVEILNSINNGILVADAGLIVKYINYEYTKITGVTKEQILGVPLQKVRPGAILPQVVATGKPMLGVYRKHGDIEYVADMAPIIVDGTTVGGVSVVKDISEVRRLSEEVRRFEKRNHHLKSAIEKAYKAKYTFADIQGNSEAMQEVVSTSKRAAKSDADVLITGESGTGKEVFAQAIHNASQRSEAPFVAVNCAAIAPSLIESELFGYDDGAFTGARKGGHIGLFEIANGGTIFLDEITELSLEMQAKLLRVLQERAIRRVGDTKEVLLDLRVLAATNQDLYELVQHNKFRADVYYRLNVLNIQLPPLRERGQDIILLANLFFEDYFRKIGRGFEIDKHLLHIFLGYNWPGNIRELRNVVEYTVNMCDDHFITPLHLPKWFKISPEYSKVPASSLDTMVKDFERRTIQKMVEHYGTSVEAKRRVAKELGISVATLYNKIREIEKTEP